MSTKSLRKSLRDTARREQALLRQRTAGQRLRKNREMRAALTGGSLVTTGLLLAALFNLLAH
jgi:hypothetical protein